MSNDVVIKNTDNKLEVLSKLLLGSNELSQSLSNNKNITIDKFAKSVIETIKNNEYLYSQIIQNLSNEKYKQSIIDSCRKCIFLKLPIDYTKKAFLVPRNLWNKNTKSNDPIISFQIGYLGWLDILYRNDNIKSVMVFAISKKDYENGRFTIHYDKNEFEYKPDLLNNNVSMKTQTEAEKNMLGCVANIITKDGRQYWQFLSYKQIIDRAMSSSMTKTDNGVVKYGQMWNDWFEEMARKTVLTYTISKSPFVTDDERQILESEYENNNIQNDSITQYDGTTIQSKEECIEYFTNWLEKTEFDNNADFTKKCMKEWDKVKDNNKQLNIHTYWDDIAKLFAKKRESLFPKKEPKDVNLP